MHVSFSFLKCLPLLLNSIKSVSWGAVMPSGSWTLKKKVQPLVLRFWAGFFFPSSVTTCTLRQLAHQTPCIDFYQGISREREIKWKEKKLIFFWSFPEAMCTWRFVFIWVGCRRAAHANSVWRQSYTSTWQGHSRALAIITCRNKAERAFQQVRQFHKNIFFFAAILQTLFLNLSNALVHVVEHTR